MRAIEPQAVIEIGSRAVRLLVAEVDGKRLTPLLTRSHETRMMGRLGGSADELAALTEELRQTVTEFEDLAKRHARRVEIFGTEAVRRLVASGAAHDDPLLARVRVLSTEEEARCSTRAALTSASHSVRGAVLVVDQGGGSVELIEAIAGETVEVLRTHSLKLGADVLLARFRSLSMDFAALKESLAAEMATNEPARHFTAAFGLGSVATKCGWLFSNPPEGTRYSAKRAQGAHITVQNMRALVELFLLTPYEKWEPWRAKFDPANPISDDLERVVTGAVVLLLLLETYRLDHFVVSTMGTRHGYLIASHDAG